MIVWSEQDWDFEGLAPFIAARRPIVDVQLPEEDVTKLDKEDEDVV